jgi:DNA-binding response OmpR family regulator
MSKDAYKQVVKMNRVIFVDDDQQYLKSLKRYLTAARVDWQTDFYSDEVLALTQIQSEEKAVVVLDMIMLTGTSGPEATINALEWGADDYLSKPVDLDALKTHITLGLSLLNS